MLTLREGQPFIPLKSPKQLPKFIFKRKDEKKKKNTSWKQQVTFYTPAWPPSYFQFPLHVKMLSKSFCWHFPPIRVLCVHGRLLIENAVGVSEGGLGQFFSTQSHNYKERQSHYWETPRTLFSDIHLIKDRLEQNIIMTTQHKKTDISL